MPRWEDLTGRLSGARLRLLSRSVVVLYEAGETQKVSSSVTIQRATRERLQDIRSFQSERYVDLFEKFLDEGHVGYLAYIDGICVHRSWVVAGPARVPLHRLMWRELRFREIFIHFCETAPRARGRRVFPAVLSRILEEWPGRRVWMAIDASNTSSRRAAERAGFRPVEELVIVGLVGARFWWRRNRRRSLCGPPVES